MEDQNTATPPVSEPVATPESGNAQEVSSTTQAADPTKRSLRVQTWKTIQEKRCNIRYSGIFNRIPLFMHNDKAATFLTETDEFKKAEHIKVNIDRALHAIKLQCLVAGKSLYLPATRESSALFLKVEVPTDATNDQKGQLLTVTDLQQHRTEIAFDSNIKLDMVIIGSVVVSRDGQRIGRGNGFADLDIGLLIEVGAITPETLIVTLVHDVQVVDSLPSDLFQKYDAPVDIIVTPTEVIRISKRLPRPTGVYWDLLSERRLKIVPVLQKVKESLEQTGKVIVLKEVDTDVEQGQVNRNRRRFVPRRRFRKNQRRTISQTENDQPQGENTNQKRNQRDRRNRRFLNRRRRPTGAKSEGEQSAAEGKSEERKPERKQKFRKNRPSRDFCIKLSNITREIRVKDLKTELRKREAIPLYISWKGQFGKCYLHYGNRNGTPSTDDDINKVLQSLNDLSLTVSTGGSTSNGEGDGAQVKPVQTKTINVNVELIKFSEKKAGTGNAENGTDGGEVGNAGDNGSGNDGGARIVSVDTTTV